MSTAAEPDPTAFTPWGLPIIPPTTPVADEEIGVTTDDDGDWVPPVGDLPLTDFLMAFAYAAHGLLRTFVLRTRLHLGLNRWRT